MPKPGKPSLPAPGTKVKLRHVAGIVHDFDSDTEAVIHFGTPEWVALLEWLVFHDIDPRTIPAFTRITRSGSGCCIRYIACRLNEDGRPRLVEGMFDTYDVVEQGEAPPKPWPDEIARLLR